MQCTVVPIYIKREMGPSQSKVETNRITNSRRRRCHHGWLPCCSFDLVGRKEEWMDNVKIRQTCTVQSVPNGCSTAFRRDLLVSHEKPKHDDHTTAALLQSTPIHSNRITTIFTVRRCPPNIRDAYQSIDSSPKQQHQQTLSYSIYTHTHTMPVNTAPIKWAQRSDSLYVTIALTGTFLLQSTL